MITLRRANQRGHADHGWLNSYHTFSFAGYQDPNHMGFRSLRVMNEDRVAPGKGFGTHAHNDMEIISYVLDGALEHKDSMGNGEVLRPGEFQCISAGTGIEHSEFNPSKSVPVHFYQIWLIPNERGLTPTYQQKRFPDEQLADQLRLVASPEGKDGSLVIHSEANVYLSKLSLGEAVNIPMRADRHMWLQVLRGSIDLGGHLMVTSDAAAVSTETRLSCKATTDSEIMLFDLA